VQILARKHQEEKGASIPQEWTQKVEDVLTSAYEKEIQEKKRKFEVFGSLFTDELLLVVSFVDSSDMTSLPVSCFLSMDINDKSDIKKLLDYLVNVSGMVFDYLFAQESLEEYGENWAEEKLNNEIVFYKISRENVAITLEADKWLEQQFFRGTCGCRY